LTRHQIADDLGIYRTSSLHYLLTTISALCDEAVVNPRSPLDDYVIWLLKIFTSPPYTEPGRSPGKKRLKREEIKTALITEPEKFSLAQYNKRLNGQRESQTIIHFNFRKNK